MHYQSVHLDILAYALLVGGPIALLFRRRAPATVLAVVMLVTICYLLRGYVFGPAVFSLVVTIVAAVTAGRRAPAWIIAGCGVAVTSGLVKPGWVD